MMPILVKGDEARSGTKVNACNGQLRLAQAPNECVQWKQKEQGSLTHGTGVLNEDIWWLLRDIQYYQQELFTLIKSYSSSNRSKSRKIENALTAGIGTNLPYR